MSEGAAAQGCVALAAGCVLAACANAGVIDLSKWAVDDITGANWTVSDAGQTVTQHLAGGASRSIFVSDFGSDSLHLRGTASVGTSSDDDFFGFVFGYERGEYASDHADYVVLDWKQDDQFTSYWGGSIFARAGLAASRVTGPAVGDAGDIDAWTHTGSYDEFARSGALGSTGWRDIVEYDFEIIYTPERIRMWVSWADAGQEHEVEALDVTAPSGSAFPTGRFGFYSFSQDEVIFRDWRTVPAPGGLALAPLAIAGAARRRRR